MIEKIEYKGKWKLPKINDWIDGTLIFDPDKGAKLELFGTFNTSFIDYSSKNVIIGETYKGDITLIDNWFRNVKQHKNSVTIGEYEPIFIFEGQHFKSNGEICFREVIFRAFNLIQWTDIKGIKHDFDWDTRNYSIEYKKPQEICFDLNDNCKGNISFDSPATFEELNTTIELKDQAYIKLKYREKKNYVEILNDISKIIGLITLCTFEQSYLERATFMDDDYFDETRGGIKKKKIACLYQNSYYNKNYRLRRKHEHLLKFEDIKDIFPDVIGKWYEKYVLMEPLYNLMLNSFKEKNKFTIEKFIDDVRALESFHRRVHNRLRIEEEDYEELTNKTLDNDKLKKNEKIWLKEKLKYGNEISLYKRLKELYKIYENKYVIDKIENVGAFCQEVVDSRNYYTHYDKTLEKKAKKGKELYEMDQKVKALLYSCIFTEIGLNKNKFEEQLCTLLHV